MLVPHTMKETGYRRLERLVGRDMRGVEAATCRCGRMFAEPGGEDVAVTQEVVWHFADGVDHGTRRLFRLAQGGRTIEDQESVDVAIGKQGF